MPTPCPRRIAALLFGLALLPSPGRAQTESFTYQGSLSNAGAAANGVHDFQFSLFNAAVAGAQQGVSLTKTGVPVTGGQFTVNLEFAPGSFTGADRWLEIGVRPGGTAGAFTILTPRQAITSSPYAIRSATATDVEGGAVRNPSFIGTTTTTPLEFRVNGIMGMRIIPAGTTPNIIGGNNGNKVESGVVGATIGGGGTLFQPNEANADYACVPGGLNNKALGQFSTAMGIGAVASGIGSVAAGRDLAASGDYSVALGRSIQASGLSAFATGEETEAVGSHSTAMGYHAVAFHNHSFVWADGQSDYYPSSAENQFNIRASGGLRLSNETSLSFGSATRQMLNLWNTEYGIGVQSDATYFRTGNDFQWYRGGVHSDTNGDGGAGGANLMTLSRSGLLGLGTKTPSTQVDVVALQAVARLTTTSNANGAVLVLKNNWASGVTLGAINFESFNGTPGQISYQANDQLAIRVGNTQRMTLDATGLTVNGTLITSSDRNRKEQIVPVNVKAVLEKVATLPLNHWRYKDDAGTAHMGPMAQDFHAAFALGADDRHIATVDADGVALAAIQGLNEKVDSADAAAAGKIAKLEAENAALRSRLDRLEKLLLDRKGK